KLAVLLRGHVQRDGYTHEVTNIHQPEGPGRLGLMLERLLVGLAAIGLEREKAMELAKTIAMDSCPPLRVKAFALLKEEAVQTPGEKTTREIALQLRLPTVTARRVLEELAAQGLASRRRDNPKKKNADSGAEEDEEKGGGADYWSINPRWGDSWS